MVSPTRQYGLERLEEFAPSAGRKYATSRNFDFGPDDRDNVSVLSPWIRHRLVTEKEIVASVLNEHSASSAEKYIQEVFWRTYWKGWLEMRPGVWVDFQDELKQARDKVADNSGLQKAIDEAESGRTGIDAFDFWAQELVETGYLHNHARMWFASIWIFTLKLPWVLGADFFLRHLLDGDPASNTMGWRWVAGIQTRGKTYLARPSNIEKFTDGRFRPTELASEAPPLEWQEPPSPAALEATPRPDELDDTPALLLIHGDDLNPESLLPDTLPIKAALAFQGVKEPLAWPFGDKAKEFVGQAVDDAAKRASSHYGVDTATQSELDADAVIRACQDAGAEAVITPYAPVGPNADALNLLGSALDDEGIALHRVRREWDSAAWPFAKKGFFPFKKKIPSLLEQAGLSD